MYYNSRQRKKLDAQASTVCAAQPYIRGIKHLCLDKVSTLSLPPRSLATTNLAAAMLLLTRPTLFRCCRRANLALLATSIVVQIWLLLSIKALSVRIRSHIRQQLATTASVRGTRSRSISHISSINPRNPNSIRNNNSNSINNFRTSSLLLVRWADILSRDLPR